MGYEVRLDVFEGPIDLLLQLISRRRVDVCEVSLSRITDDYLQVLASSGLDLESATGFLVVAATLLELKSSRLLPSHEPEEADLELLEERDRLLARLVECATFREAGAWIGGRLEEGGGLHPRSVALEPRFAGLAPDPLEGIGPEDLARAAAEALRAKHEPELDISHVTPIRVTVREAVEQVAGVLRQRGSASFAELCTGATARIEVVVRFLALLELYKVGAVELSQNDRFGEIEATWTGRASADEALAEAEEYGFEAGEEHAFQPREEEV